MSCRQVDLREGIRLLFIIGAVFLAMPIAKGYWIRFN
jgi:hypothetical protein